MMFYQIMTHIWRKGHSITVNRYMTQMALDSSRGWLYKCECGQTWAR